jgi:hypothetical protein
MGDLKNRLLDREIFGHEDLDLIFELSNHICFILNLPFAYFVRFIPSVSLVSLVPLVSLTLLTLALCLSPLRSDPKDEGSAFLGFQEMSY